jgi:hypothetical protein
MSALAFTHDRNGVTAADGPRSYRLNDRQCENLLDLFDEVGAVRLFNALYIEHMAAGGIPRCCTLKGAVAA